MCSTSMCISAYFSAKKKTAAMAAVIFIMIRVNCQGPLLVWNRLINSSSSSFKQRCQARRCSASSRQKSTRSFVLRWSTLRLKLTHSREKKSVNAFEDYRFRLKFSSLFFLLYCFFMWQMKGKTHLKKPTYNGLFCENLKKKLKLQS